MEHTLPQPTEVLRTSLGLLTPELQAALDAANAQLAALAKRHAPTVQATVPPLLAHELVAWGKIKLKPLAAELLTPELTSQAFFELLLKHDQLADARRILAHAMPKRRALWWGVLCMQDTFRSQPPADVTQLLRLVTQFVALPTDDTRRACGEFGKRFAPNTMAACLATAAMFSGGSVSPPGLPPVAPRPFVTGRLVGVCVYLASVTRDAAQYKQYMRAYLNMGRSIASGELALPSEPVISDPPHHSRLAPHWPAKLAALAGA
jgi:hypothetical protein